MIGDTLVVEEGTDIDSIVVSWGENVKYHQRLNEMRKPNQERTIGKFSPFKIFRNTNINGDSHDETEKSHSLKAMNHLVLEKTQAIPEDVQMLDAEQFAAELKARQELEEKRLKELQEKEDLEKLKQGQDEY